MTHSRDAQWKEVLREKLAYAGVSPDSNGMSILEDFISVIEEKAEQRGAEAVVDYVEAECEWVKEDVPDGNDGYFMIRASQLEKARKLNPVTE